MGMPEKRAASRPQAVSLAGKPESCLYQPPPGRPSLAAAGCERLTIKPA